MSKRKSGLFFLFAVFFFNLPNFFLFLKVLAVVCVCGKIGGEEIVGQKKIIIPIDFTESVKIHQNFGR